jgi:hypothetical protein
MDVWGFELHQGILEALQRFSAFSMLGVIWIVQLILYPAFAAIDRQQFLVFHQTHTQRITLVVGPLMALELFCATGLFFLYQQSVVGWINLITVAALFATTALVSVPLHTRLTEGQDAKTIARLVATNWYRTGLWTARAAMWLLI